MWVCLLLYWFAGIVCSVCLVCCGGFGFVVVVCVLHFVVCLVDCLWCLMFVLLGFVVW